MIIKDSQTGAFTKTESSVNKYGNLASVTRSGNKPPQLTYYVTEPSISGMGTIDTLYKYTQQLKGFIVAEKGDPLIVKVEKGGTVSMRGGTLFAANSSGTNRIVENYGNSNDEKIHVINTGAADADGNKPNGNYRLATATENADGTKTYETGSTTTLITGVDGKITVTGLNSGTYTLKEIKTANGYNLLSGTVDVNLNIDTETVWNTEETFENGVWQKKVSVKQTTYTGGEDSDNNNYVTKTIVNKMGFTLPATGGIGTLMFIIIGGVLMAGGICLIVPNKKRAI